MIIIAVAAARLALAKIAAENVRIFTGVNWYRLSIKNLVCRAV